MDSSQLYRANADAFSLWLDTDRAARSRAGNVRQLLKEEDQLRVIERLVAHLPQPVVSKVYHVPPQLAWRNLFLPSRARREYRHLQYAFKRGLPVVEPLAWSETRVWGFAIYSQLTLVRVEGQPMPEAMQDPRMTVEVRRQLAVRLGELLARMHQAGLVWMTAYARNVLVDFNTLDEAGPRLTAIDFPNAWCSGVSMVGSSCAHTDLWWMRWTLEHQCGFDATLLEQLVQAYAQQAGLDATALSRKISRRSKLTCALNRMYVRSRNWAEEYQDQARSARGRAGS